jgi:hypothetical protein
MFVARLERSSRSQEPFWWISSEFDDEWTDGLLRGCAQTIAARFNSHLSAKAPDAATGTTPSGPTTYVGPRGGVYHYSKSGKKVYDRHRK